MIIHALAGTHYFDCPAGNCSSAGSGLGAALVVFAVLLFLGRKKK